MNEPTKSGGELFIIDNSDESWKGLRYIQDWTEIASAFDITIGAKPPEGYFLELISQCAGGDKKYAASPMNELPTGTPALIVKRLLMAQKIKTSFEGL